MKALIETNDGLSKLIGIYLDEEKAQLAYSKAISNANKVRLSLPKGCHYDVEYSVADIDSDIDEALNGKIQYT